MNRILLSLTLLGACQSDPPPAHAELTAPAQQRVPTLDRGATVFAANCASCHGAEGKGDGPAGATLKPPPADLVGPRAAHLRGIPRRSIIEDGLENTAMVGWKTILPPDDLEAVYGFVHNMKHGDGGHRGRRHERRKQ